MKTSMVKWDKQDLIESYTLDIYSIYNDVIVTFSRKKSLLLFRIQILQSHNCT